MCELLLTTKDILASDAMWTGEQIVAVFIGTLMCLHIFLSLMLYKCTFAEVGRYYRRVTVYIKLHDVRIRYHHEII